ncbi:hypothetical protein NSE_0593 [Neorickettsia sennetsu str. Miyayama]|uniref:Uncharacterized protein n=1 Tax=Ehrlichia sennetsu (strain ATCC VR-367 / Miyayama) TaxID=222891 RepID=Q2GDH3_EHRS3|nr:hypothetical protein NSE_0593 [Neorickettsia sennetsu str. Miyayama]
MLCFPDIVVRYLIKGALDSCHLVFVQGILRSSREFNRVAYLLIG